MLTLPVPLRPNRNMIYKSHGLAPIFVIGTALAFASWRFISTMPIWHGFPDSLQWKADLQCSHTQQAGTGHGRTCKIGRCFSGRRRAQTPSGNSNRPASDSLGSACVVRPLNYDRPYTVCPMSLPPCAKA